ncbi:MAG: M20/M25/M40 family metallo-hydrolase [Myxococcales bacterium]|nr:M20/M25/M40 family metallo-hydrolase [Myxococcales bacterium]
MEALDSRVAALAARDSGLAAQILAEAIRIPADHIGGPDGDPSCGLSNHEGPRLRYLMKTIIEIRAVDDPADVWFDDFGNLVWQVSDPSDGVPPDERKVIWFDGHSDTVRALRSQWQNKTGGLDAYDGLVDPEKLDRSFLRQELGWLPPDDQWHHLLFGRGSADQLGGVVAQVVATRILLALRDEGALRGVTVRAIASVAEEDNDGGGPMFMMAEQLPGAAPGEIPDVVVLTEGTGDANKGSLGIYRGQRGRMQIEVNVTGRSCHGSMPWEGLNPLEYGAAILVEARQQFDAGESFKDHAFLGAGTRTASWAQLDTPSDCAVPERFTFRFDRRLTVGESPEAAVAAITGLPAVSKARADGLQVDVGVPTYAKPTWRGYTPGNPAIYPGWETPAEHPAITAAVSTWQNALSPEIRENRDGNLRPDPRVDRWIFSTDGVGFAVDKHTSGIDVPESKRWLSVGDITYPPMFGVGPGIEQNTHKIGECVDLRELRHAIAFLARFPSVFGAAK